MRDDEGRALLQCSECSQYLYYDEGADIEEPGDIHKCGCDDEPPGHVIASKEFVLANAAEMM